jgi:hypothetical protein
MSRQPWLVRVGQPGDRALLMRFTCADPTVPWQVEVEHFIQRQLVDWAFDQHAASADPRLLLVFDVDSGHLVGVAAHERVVLQGPEGKPFDATKLEVVGITTSWQGRRFASGERASDVLMSALMTDVSARVPSRDARVFAIVHEDNKRSLALCQRYGLVEEMSRPHPSYRRIVTAHRYD